VFQIGLDEEIGRILAISLKYGNQFNQSLIYWNYSRDIRRFPHLSGNSVWLLKQSGSSEKNRSEKGKTLKDLERFLFFNTMFVF
jgi:hypothetical protein